MTEAIIKTMELSKHYDGFVAVDRLSLEVYEGEVFGLLGPNGAGKTTFISMLLGLTYPTYGRAWVAGKDVVKEPLEVKRLVGLVPENIGLYDELTARQNLYYTAALNNIKGQEAKERAEELLSSVGLLDWIDVKVRKFSRGMKQRLGIANSLMKRPKVLILDEPTAGIDPEGAEHILTIIRNLAKGEGVTVLQSSHLLYQVQKVCDRVGIMSKGRLVAVGTIDSLSKELTGKAFSIEVEVDLIGEGLLDSLKKVKGVVDVKVDDRFIRIYAEEDVRKAIARTIVEGGSSILRMQYFTPALDEIYLRYFGG